ncbi:MAG: DUF4175 family protein [Vicingaceae bacterium]
MSNSNYSLLVKKLDEFIRKYYLNKLIRGGLWFISLALLLFLIVSVLEYIGQFNSQVRTWLFYGSLLSLGAVFATFVLLPLSKIASLGKRISHEKASQIIGKHFADVDDKLYNVLQLKSTSETESSNLIEASINQKIDALKPIPFHLAINLGENKKYLKYAIPPTVVILAIVYFSPQVLSESTNRLVAHDREFVPLAPYSIEISNEKLQTFKNDDYKLKVRLEGKSIPNQLKVKFKGQSYLMRKTETNQFQFVFKNMSKDVDFELTDGEFDSKIYTLKVLPKPLMTSFQIELNYPSYISKRDQTIENRGDLSVPQGTLIKWKFITDYTSELNFYWQDSSFLCLQTAENQFVYENRFFKSGLYGFSNGNEFLNHEDTLFYQLEVIPDLRPSIEVDSRKDSLNPSMIYFKGMIKDDYGFSRLAFYVEKPEQKETEFHQTQIPINKNLTQTDFYHQINLSDYDLKAGDQLKFYFEVWDNDGVNGSKASRTPLMTYKAPSSKELKEKEEKSNQKIKEKLKENIKLSREIKRDLESIKEKMLSKKKLGFQEKKQLEELMKKQNQLKQNMSELNKENKQKNRLQNEHEPMSEEMLEKQKQIEDLFEKVMSEEMKKLMDEMNRLMEEMDEKKLQDELEKMEMSNEDMEKELDRNLELFKQLELEKQLQDAQKKLEKLKEDQANLKTKTEEKKTDSKELKREQEKLNADFDDLEKDLDDLKKKNQELEQPFEMEKTDKLEDQIKEDMKETAESLGENKKKDASDSQDEAQEGMEELSEKLEGLQMQMQAGSQAENLEDLRSLLDNLITLSFEQENVMQKLKKIDRTDPQYVSLAQEQNKLQDDSKVIEDSLFALSKRVIQLAPIVNREMSSIKRNMEKAVELLGERKTPLANSRQQLAMTSINNLALMLDEAVQSMQKQMQSQMQSKSQCKKPGSKPGGKPSMGGLKKMQQQLQKQMEGLKKSMQDGKMPGKKEGKGKGGMSKQLAQMAAKQAAIRKALKEMQDQIGKSEGGGGGSLEKIGELMEENETDLVNKRISNETILRQQEILTRLLQSEKAEREREKDPKREAREFNDNFSRNPDEFFEYNRRKEKEIELLRTLPPTFNQFYKNKVTDYFNQLQP